MDIHNFETTVGPIITNNYIPHVLDCLIADHPTMRSLEEKGQCLMVPFLSDRGVSLIAEVSFSFGEVANIDGPLSAIETLDRARSQLLRDLQEQLRERLICLRSPIPFVYCAPLKEVRFLEDKRNKTIVIHVVGPCRDETTPASGGRVFWIVVLPMEIVPLAAAWCGRAEALR